MTPPLPTDMLDLLEPSRLIAPLDRRRQVFVNRNLRFDKVKTVGFDMDYTLAIYSPHRIEELAFRVTVDKLVSQRGYPEGVRELHYEPDRVIRGLVVDKRRGNIFKMDRYNHVGRVWHGERPIEKEQRIQLYRRKKIEVRTQDYAWVDTLFALPEVCLYSLLVDWMDVHAPSFLQSYGQLYDDIREMIDQAHADGSLKKIVMQDLPTYVERDPYLARTLHRLRSSGKRLFLLTNSYWLYSNAVMSYLLDDVMVGYPSWRAFFDIVLVGARKPSFFTADAPFLQVDLETGEASAKPATRFDKGKVYQGGNRRDFETMAKLGGDHVVYVGDHIYGDMLKSKKSSLWRTAMIVPELEEAIWHRQLFAPEIHRLGGVLQELRRLDYEINYYKLTLAARPPDGQSGPTDSQALASLNARSGLEALRQRVRELLAERDGTQDRLEASANPYWGSLFREDNEMSLFGKQVEDYACIYTSRVSNLLFYSPLQYFRSPRNTMPHEEG